MRGHTHTHTRLHSKPYFDLDVGLANSAHSRNTSSSSTTTSSSVFQQLSSSIPVTTSLSFTTPLKIAPTPEPTRVQLQRQRLQEQHARTPVSKARTIPAFKTSAAFFASLRTNLRLHASPPPSPLSTPPSMRGSTTSLPPPSPLSFPALSMDDHDPASDDHDDHHHPPHDPLDGVPELTSYLTTDDAERTEGLKLVADSVAQQRQLANQTLLYNPANLAVMIAILSFAGRYVWRRYHHDYYILGMTVIGLIMAGMAGARFATQGYLFAAEEINWEWVGDSDVLVTKFGEEVIAAVVIEWVSGESRQKRKKAWRGLIRAWTVRLKYRGKGVGSALLEEAVGEAKRKGAEGLEFAEDHANSRRVLPAFYNGYFDRQDRNARELLENLMQSSPGRGKRK
ncbi:unnamed protein product [Zymoseptoria tritici ST99CH_1A5]|uniref:N-acetyltransferase domain-containing protein n=1 Tax=Zymoseptoria tritici ST99CH_1A5 TaxID=1276529 RepID=A0A1Y6LX24_ZYMTR|nr:unnamed protein product [Zymoseptoria tritici ST99CH_1A5]